MRYANPPALSWRNATRILTALSFSLLAGCGGGSGSGTPSPASSTAPAPVVPAVPVPVTPPATAALTNFQPITVSAGPAGGVNLLHTSITVCPPGGPTGCRTIDDVLVDTGSTGLRLFASVLPASLTLPQQAAPNGAPLAECGQFADGYTWGPVRRADVRLGGETLRNLSVQVMGDPAFQTVPTGCSATGPAENTVADFGSNGVLGIGNFINDCGDACVRTALSGFYYSCSSAGCTPTRVPAAQQLQHPASLLAKDNNGVLLQLPAVAPEGATGLAGTMIFGIGTESNNGLGSARVYTVDAQDATLQISVNGVPYASSFFDSGSNGTFFPSSTIPSCGSGFYCPLTPQTISAVVQGKNGTNTAFDFLITNADAMFRDHPSFTVFPTLGGSTFGTPAVDLGLPFYFGKTVYTAIEGKSTPGGTGPYVAF